MHPEPSYAGGPAAYASLGGLDRPAHFARENPPFLRSLTSQQDSYASDYILVLAFDRHSLSAYTVIFLAVLYTKTNTYM